MYRGTLKDSWNSLFVFFLNYISSLFISICMCRGLHVEVKNNCVELFSPSSSPCAEVKLKLPALQGKLTKEMLSQETSGLFIRRWNGLDATVA